MIPVVFDANVVVSGCGWTSDAYLCLAAVAKRRVRSLASEEIVAEWSDVVRRLEAKETPFRRSPWPTLEWLVERTRIVTPAPLGKRRSRDEDDDIYLGTAIAAKARFVVTRGPDLLTFGKPFGIEMVTPRTLLSRLLSGRG